MKKNTVAHLFLSLTIGITTITYAKFSASQTNMNLLTPVADSCQKTASSLEEYEKLIDFDLHDDRQDRAIESTIPFCIRNRYYYFLLLTKFPWLNNKEDLFPGYRASVAVSQLAYSMDEDHNRYSRPATSSDFLNCLITQTSHSPECGESLSFATLYQGYLNQSRRRDNYYFHNNHHLAWICPNCFVAYNNEPSGNKMIDSFINWFTRQTSLHKRDLMTLFGNQESNYMLRKSLRNQAIVAGDEYEEIKRRVLQKRKEEKLRNLLR